MWQVDNFAPQVVLPPEKGRWGVYGFAYPVPIRNTEDFVRMCHSFPSGTEKKAFGSHGRHITSRCCGRVPHATGIVCFTTLFGACVTRHRASSVIGHYT